MTLREWIFGDPLEYRDQRYRDRVKALIGESKPKTLYGVKGGLSRWEREQRKQRSVIRFDRRA